MVTEETLNQLSRLLGLRLESILLEADHTDRLISDSTYYSQRYLLRKRALSVSEVPEVPFTVWKQGNPIVLASDDNDGLESECGDA